MKYLLDTCTLIWLLQKPNKLSTRVKQLIENPHNEVIVSTISFWEISLKHSIGKPALKNIELEDLEEIVNDKLRIAIIGLNEQESLSYHRLPYFERHRDPFDRMLAWQAIKRGMALISSDAAFNAYRQCGLQLIC